MYMMLRFVDASNFIRIGNAALGGKLVLQIITAGSITVSQEIGTKVEAGDIVQVLCVGNMIQARQNGEAVYTLYSAQGYTSTNVGFQMSGAVQSRIDSFVVAPI